MKQFEVYYVKEGQDNGKILLVDFIWGRLLFFDPRSNTVISSINIPKGEQIKHASLQPKGDLVLVVTTAAYRLYNRKTGQLEYDLRTQPDLRFSSLANKTRWSPDGDKLLYPSRESKSLNIFLPESGKSKEVVGNLLFQIMEYNWSPDGKTIAYLEGEYSNLKIVGVDYGNFGRVLDTVKTPINQSNLYIDWISDGTVMLANNFERNFWDLRTKKVIASGTASFTRGEKGNWQYKDAYGQPLSDLQSTGFPKKYEAQFVKVPGTTQKTIEFDRITEDLVVFGDSDNYLVSDNEGHEKLKISFESEKTRGMDYIRAVHFLVDGKQLKVIRSNGKLSIYKLPN